MHKTSQIYEEILKAPHRVETALRIGGEDTVRPCQEITGTVYGEGVIVSITEKADLLNREAPGIGYFISRKIEVEMLEQPQRIGIMGRIVPFCRLVNEENGKTSEWIPKGVFYVDTRKKTMVESDAATVTFTCYDAALKAQEDYDGGNMTWPSLDVAVVANIAKLIGVECDNTNIGKGFSIIKPENKTCGEVLGAIAALYGGNFTIDDCGVLRLLPLKSGEIAAHLDCQKLKMSTPSEPIESVVLHTGSGQKFRAGDGVTLEAISPFATQEAADNALQTVKGYRYLAFQAKQTIFHPALELGDHVAVGAADGVLYNYYIDLCSCVGEVGAPEEYEINRNYPYTSPAGRSAAAANKKALEAVDGVLDFSNGLLAALGAEEGAPENLVAGLKNYVRYDLKNGELMANSALIAKIGEEARGEIRVYAVKSGDTTKTLAEILADQITLTSEVDNAKAEIDLKADEKAVEILDRRVVETEKATASLATRLGDAEASLNQKAESKTVSDLSGRVTNTEAAQTDIANRVADAETALQQTVSKKTFSDAIDSQDEAIAEAQEAVANLSSRVGSAEASLTLKAESKTVTALDGRVTEVSSSVAELSADVIKLQGRVDLTGSLSVEGGRITAKKSIYTSSNVFANKFWSDSESIRLGTRDYAPAEITSTTGAVFRALGA